MHGSAYLRNTDGPSAILGIEKKINHGENSQRTFSFIQVDKNKIYYPVDVPDDAKSFIEQLVQKDPASRPKCRDLLKHPFFTNNLKGPPLKKL